MIGDAEKRASNPYENIRTPRPWEIDTDDNKKKYLKSAYVQLGSL